MATSKASKSSEDTTFAAGISYMGQPSMVCTSLCSGVDPNRFEDIREFSQRHIKDTSVTNCLKRDHNVHDCR